MNDPVLIPFMCVYVPTILTDCNLLNAKQFAEHEGTSFH